MAKPISLGIDLGGTGIKMGIVDSEGRLGRAYRFATPSKGEPQAVVELIIEHARLLLDAVPKPRVCGIGVGAAGDIDPDNGVVRLSPNLGWRNVPLQSILRRALRLPVRVENDANAAAWAAYVVEARRAVDTLICVTLGTGIGGGIILNGKLYRGATGSAGEIGHMTLYPEGVPCNCGNQGCLERYIGAKALAEAARRAIETGQATLMTKLVNGDASQITPLIINEAARKGDRLALQLFEQAGERLGVGLASVVNLLNPDWLVLAGGLSRAGRLLVDPLRRTLLKRSFPAPGKAVKLLVSRRDRDLGILGAGLIAHER